MVHLLLAWHWYIQVKNFRKSWRTIMRWNRKIDADYVERIIGSCWKNVGDLLRPTTMTTVYPDAAGEAWENYFENV